MKIYGYQKKYKPYFVIFLGFLISLLVTGIYYAGQAETVSAKIEVYDVSIGKSTEYLGACEGNVRFDESVIEDLGINTYRIYGGMPRWEAVDDDGKYGWPTIEEIKADPDVINWRYWDRAMTFPENQSDYWFSGVPEDIWKGNARTIFQTLKDHQVRPVVSLRNTNPGWNPSWALQLNPPRTDSDWNEWWEHVFATVYWLNVRNDYHVDDFEVHNEPDNRGQGWGGSQADYFKLVQVTQNAIQYVYETYLPDREYYIHAPVTTQDSTWPRAVIREVPDFFNAVNIHNYAEDISTYSRQVHEWMDDSIHSNSPLWMTEWGTWKTGYSNIDFSLNLIKNMIRGSQPGSTYIYGSHLFSLYDWGRKSGFEGLIDADGNRRLSYYAFRMGIRALQGGRSVLLSHISTSNIFGIVTRDESNAVSVLIVNSSDEPYPVEVDLSRLNVSSEGQLWAFSELNLDEVVGHPNLKKGRMFLNIPEKSSFLVRFES